jgi:hypothetical protein
MLKKCYVRGLVSKEDFAAALCSHIKLPLMQQKVHRGRKQMQQDRFCGIHEPAMQESKSHFIIMPT